MTRTARSLSLVAVLLLGVASCGGDDDEGRSKRFIAKADAICADANEQEEALDPGGLGWHYGPKFSDPQFLWRFNAVGRAALRRLRALAPPDEERKAVDAVLSAIEQSVGAIDKQIAELRAGRRDGTAANVGVYEDGYKDLAASAGPLGLTQCQGMSH